MNLSFPLIVLALKSMLPLLLAQFDAGSAGYMLVQLAISLLSRYSLSHSHADSFQATLEADEPHTFRARAQGSVSADDLPPQDQWNTEGWLAWAEAHGGKNKGKNKAMVEEAHEGEEAEPAPEA